jgi:predicted RNA-binding Zn-ribbon protein involved in translation (DUF1610 family)
VRCGEISASQKLCGPATKDSPKRLAVATMRHYPIGLFGDSNEDRTMQLQAVALKPAGIRSFAASMRCPHCGDPMIAPEMSEFVVGGEIRHHWQCDNCGGSSSTTFRTGEKNRNRRNR